MKRYSSEYDSVYDDEKLIWLEGTCSDPECDFCKDKPLFPVLNENDSVMDENE